MNKEGNLIIHMVRRGSQLLLKEYGKSCDPSSILPIRNSGRRLKERLSAFITSRFKVKRSGKNANQTIAVLEFYEICGIMKGTTFAKDQ